MAMPFVSSFRRRKSEAEAIHGITLGLLRQHGHSVYEVANTLNQNLFGTTVYSDGWVVDKPWLIELFSAAGISMGFTISSIETLLDEYQIEIWDETKQQVINALNLTRHRASSDAKIIQETYMRTNYSRQLTAS